MPLKEISDIKFIPTVDRYDYDATYTDQIVYAGFADRGKQASEDGWRIVRYTYNVNRQIVLKETAFGIWDNRASLTYT